jgi:glucose/arabinose dehydrogenase
MKSSRIVGAVLAALALALLGASGAQAASLQLIGHFAEPMFVTSPPTEPDRLFVAQRDGRIEQVLNGAVTNFADLRPVIGCCPGEQGLQSIAIAPDFATTGRFYVDHTDPEGNIRIDELRAAGATASLATLRNVLTIPFPADANHYGGQIQFGSDGYLYVSTGDGGHGGNEDEHHNAQSTGSLLGKILRIDPAANGVLPYTVPPGNPYPAAAPPYNAIWSIGLRNPFRFSFDRSDGSIAIGDVGENEREEVDILPAGASAGANFGWNCFEGRLPGAATDPECAPPPPGGYVNPVFEYPHKDLGGAYGCAIIGGYVVRDPSLGDLYGRYLYADFCTADVRSFALADPAGTDRSEGLTVGEPTSFGEDSCGRLYVAARSGTVSRLVGSSPAWCNQIKARVGIKAQRRQVKRGRRALISTFVSPCKNPAEVTVTLYRGRARVGSTRLGRACTAIFHPRISRRANFRAKIAAGPTYEAGTSRKLTIRLDHRKSKR